MRDAQKTTIISVLVVLLVALGGIYFLSSKPYFMDAPKVDTPLPESPEMKKQFKDFLNQFLKDVNDAMNKYRAERKVLIQAVGPLNLRTPVYVEENYTLVKKLIPSLRGKMNDVIKVFEDADPKMDALLLNQPDNVKQAILQKWDALKDTQGKVYTAYFTTEVDMMAAYDNLMNFYYAKRNEFRVNEETREITFTNPADKAEEEKLKQRIKDMYADQKKILGTDDDEKPAAPADRPAATPPQQ